ncbi:MAG: hypothetical protein M1354_04520 [Candidatus Marsarchaeota archaeon]|nr:hypothetical protein [Candidatus Marsarchaeota archaeon]
MHKIHKKGRAMPVRKDIKKVGKKAAVRAGRKVQAKQRPQKQHVGHLVVSRPDKKNAPSVARAANKRAGEAKPAKADPHAAVLAAAAVEDTARVNEILKQEVFSEFVTRNVGRLGVDLIKTLNSSPSVDDKLAARANIKVNEVRRVLNVLNGYGMTKYDVNKDGKGWLTFKWYLDKHKIRAFYDSLCEKEGERKITLPEDCNDFFYCVSCYSEQKVILPFDSAFDAEFKCDCGKKLVVVDKEHAVSLYNDTKN